MGGGGKTKICNYVRVADLGSDDFHYFRWMLQSFYTSTLIVQMFSLVL